MDEDNNYANQKCLILAYMKEHEEGITPHDAAREFGCWRLGARIFDLRQDGYDIEKEMSYYKDNKGRTRRFARYKLKGAAECQTSNG